MSGAALDMSLEDIIKNNKKSASRGRGRAGGGGPGPARRQPNRSANRAAPYLPPKAPESVWAHDMFPGSGRASASSIETGAKLYISNLDYGVSNEDIMELFAEVGDLKRCNVDYDRTARSKGTAEVVFSWRQDALAAIKKYNNVQLDGKPMKIELVGTNIPTAGGARLPTAGAFRDPNAVPPRQGRGGFGRPRGGGRGRGFGRGGRGLGKSRGEKISAEDLDADLDKYHAESMQTN
ncbi:RNA-binding (RRM/RBD/RNP motifs) family protein [Striga asiatica]|uniref:RNA-binding (RRM/RBD/RNP motifs) family protein n=1 Tax=Striga asiatica TaxID=4170 RepID=A0A5A7REK9_STRAF|nr:RNA-binding (RRM/RBD/RNP motifs) family protein [Striga asiatica]